MSDQVVASTPKWFSKNFITFSIVLLFFSGILLTPSALNHRLELDLPLNISGKLRLFATAIHILMMCICLFILGGISVIHTKIGLKKKQNIVSGTSLYSFFVLLVLTGLVILYAGNEDLITTSSVIHILAGILLFVAYLIHMILKKKPKD